MYQKEEIRTQANGVYIADISNDVQFFTQNTDKAKLVKPNRQSLKIYVKY